MGTKHVTCRYFLHGVCREGSNCHFSHDVHNSAPSLVCRYYQRGACAYGDRCRYDHVKATSRVGGAPVQAGGGAPVQAGGGAPVQAGGGAPIQAGAGGGATALRNPPVSASAAPPAVFYPPQSYVDATRSGLQAPGSAAPDSAQLCPYLLMGECRYGDGCVYLHGDRCEVCGLHLLHPTDAEQRREHEKLCLLEFEVDMENAFAAQMSQDKVCSICMEVVVQKVSQSERRFGILSSCDHCFCLSCIRKWRHAPFSNDVIKACPECRIPSELVIPSVHWVQDPEQKDQLVALFKNAVGKKPCKFFLEGRGTCPFGDRCLYLHLDPFGRKPGPERVRKQLGPEGNIRFMNNVRLWDFIEERETRTAPLTDDITAQPDDITAQPDDITAQPDDIIARGEELSRSLQQLSTADT
ncbi:E3 ubiquitin-protein ligase makorin-2 [Eucyclogobius newberryi]|uniref:E3 ubiquitin-protein ligase makorin-2 n=1 Tax=Eucyclogobius newberryi TaxID=166745 RepID=UPI003B5BBF1A